MTKVHLSSDFSIPLDACTQTFAWIGRKGSGKTYGAGKLAEELLEASIQIVILDTVGNWYGLRIGKDGKRKGYEVPVFGGLRQDLPLLATAGEVVADVVVESRSSVILDVSQFNFSDRKRFAADFGARLWQRKKGEANPAPLHLIIEECQLIVPQFVGKDETRMVHVYEEIIRLGRNYGIGVSMLTQRPQSVNKEVLTQAECIMAFQLNGVPERKALKEWLTHEGGDVNLVNELPGLPVGTCYLWSPQWLRKFQKIVIGKKRTFDASSTPKVGQLVARRDPAPLDVNDIESRMSATIEKAKADDPKELRRRIAELDRQLLVAKQITPATPQIKEVPVILDAQIKTLQELVHSGSSFIQQFRSVTEELVQLLSKVVHHQPRLSAPLRPRHDVSRPVMPKPFRVADEDNVTLPQQRILDSLAWLQTVGVQRGRRSQVAFLAGASPRSSAFTNNLGSLRSRGLISYPTVDYVILEASGLGVASVEAPPLSPSALHAKIFEKLPKPQCEILKVLIALYPGGVSRERLGVEAGASPTSSAFMNNLGALRSLGFIDYPEKNHVAAQPILFLE